MQKFAILSEDDDLAARLRAYETLIALVTNNSLADVRAIVNGDVKLAKKFVQLAQQEGLNDCGTTSTRRQ